MDGIDITLRSVSILFYIYSNLDFLTQYCTMIRSICIALATIQYCLAFSPHQLAPSQSQLGHPDHLLLAPTGDYVVRSSSSVLSRMRSRKTTLNVFSADTNSNNNEIEGQYPDYNSDPNNEMMDSVDTTMAGGGVGDYSKEDELGLERETANVGDPQIAQLTPMNITKVLTELQAIQSQGPKKYCILGTRHCSFLHQQIVEML